MNSRGSTCTHQNNGITTLTYLTITETREMEKKSTPEPQKATSRSWKPHYNEI